MLIAYNAERARPTKDIDFLSIGLTGDGTDIEHVARDIISSCQNDGVVFLPELLRSLTIKDGERSHDVRVKLDARIGSTRINLQIDFGFARPTLRLLFCDTQSHRKSLDE